MDDKWPPYKQEQQRLLSIFRKIPNKENKAGESTCTRTQIVSRLGKPKYCAGLLVQASVCLPSLIAPKFVHMDWRMRKNSEKFELLINLEAVIPIESFVPILPDSVYIFYILKLVLFI